MPKTVTFKVTREDLKGKYTDPEDCSIARASKRFFDQQRVCVVPDQVRIPFWRMRYKLRPWDNLKAMCRSRTFLGWLLGGFTVVLTELPE